MGVFFKSLYGYSEVMLVKSFEVARIADKYAVIICKEILELGGCGILNPAKEDVCIARIDGYSVNSR